MNYASELYLRTIPDGKTYVGDRDVSGVFCVFTPNRPGGNVKKHVNSSQARKPMTYGGSGACSKKRADLTWEMRRSSELTRVGNRS